MENSAPSTEELADTLRRALATGPVYAIGGIVYGPQRGEPPLMNTTQLFHAIQAVSEAGPPVHRLDSGGQPTWDYVAPDAAA